MSAAAEGTHREEERQGPDGAQTVSHLIYKSPAFLPKSSKRKK